MGKGFFKVPSAKNETVLSYAHLDQKKEKIYSIHIKKCMTVA